MERVHIVDWHHQNASTYFSNRDSNRNTTGQWQARWRSPQTSYNPPLLLPLAQTLRTSNLRRSKQQPNKATPGNLASSGDDALPVCSALRHRVAYVVQSPWHSTVLQKCKKGDDGDNCNYRLTIRSQTASKILRTVDQFLSWWHASWWESASHIGCHGDNAPKVGPKKCILILSLVESIIIDGQIYATVKELQWVFSAMEVATYIRLVCLASYIHVSSCVKESIDST
jgi:hypothetical protein